MWIFFSGFGNAVSANLYFTALTSEKLPLCSVLSILMFKSVCFSAKNTTNYENPFLTASKHVDFVHQP